MESVLTQAYVRLLFQYSPKTGVLTFATNRGPYKAGTVVSSINSRGYLRVGIDGKNYLAHRIAWLWTYGYLPKILDHMNGVKTDNRIINLRAASQSQNCGNRKTPRNNTSGYKGVTYHRPNKKWMAQIGYSKTRRKNLGYYETPEEAHAAYEKAALSYFGEFARTA